MTTRTSVLGSGAIPHRSLQDKSLLDKSLLRLPQNIPRSNDLREDGNIRQMIEEGPGQTRPNAPGGRAHSERQRSSRPPQRQGPRTPNDAARAAEEAVRADEARGPGVTATAQQNMRARLPELVSCRQIQEELSVTRAAAEAVMRQLDKIRFLRQPPRLRTPRRRPPTDRGINHQMNETSHRQTPAKEEAAAR